MDDLCCLIDSYFGIVIDSETCSVQGLIILNSLLIWQETKFVSGEKNVLYHCLQYKRFIVILVLTFSELTYKNSIIVIYK